MSENAAVLLIDPKYPHNVGGVLRACAVFDAIRLVWTGDRVPAPETWPKGARLPREERMKAYRKVKVGQGAQNDAVSTLAAWGYTPVAVELRDGAEDLREFVHPAQALYVFGPEDGSIPKGVLTVCHRFVRIPSDGCLNLAAAVNVVLYDRLSKTTAPV